MERRPPSPGDHAVPSATEQAPEVHAAVAAAPQRLVVGLGLVLVADPVLHRPEQVAEVEVARGLDTGEDARHGR